MTTETPELRHSQFRLTYPSGTAVAQVEASRREDWIFEHEDRGIEMLITHPNLVGTGLDLLADGRVPPAGGLKAYAPTFAEGIRSGRRLEAGDERTGVFGNDWLDGARRRCLSTSGPLHVCGLEHELEASSVAFERACRRWRLVAISRLALKFQFLVFPVAKSHSYSFFFQDLNCPLDIRNFHHGNHSSNQRH